MKANGLKVVGFALMQLLTQKVAGIDWRFFQGAFLVSGGMLLARLFGLGFSLILARTLAPDDFGTVQYTLAAANILAIGVQPFGQHVMARFISHNVANPERLTGIFHHGWLIFLLLLGISLLLSLLTAWFSDKLGMEVLVVVGGIALFYGYWGVCRGYLASGLLTAVYLGSNVVQFLAVLLVVGWFEINTPAVALLIYGLSYVPILLWIQGQYGLTLFPGRIGWNLQGSIIHQLMRFALPITLSHGAFMLFMSVDLIYLNQWVAPNYVGQYAFAKTLATAFSFIPMGISTLLMPRVAMTKHGNNRQIVLGSIGISLLVNLFFLFIFWFLVSWFVLTLFGDSYLAPTYVYLLLAVASIFMGIQSVITAAYVGLNRPEIETLGRVVAAVAALLCCWLLIPVYGLTGAAMSLVFGVLLSLGIYGFYFVND
ncbi:MAG: polysaccharide biosynthesis C-terminal domain-containing protein [Chloroflexota bacterium]